jgi:hypothetical protein
MADRRWISAHVFHSDPLDPLLHKAIRPLVAELLADGLVERYFFLRYWEGGPHVRLRLLPTTGAVPERIRQTVAQRCTAYLRGHPSTAVPAPGYAAVAAQLARAEGLTGYTTTLYPNDSVQFIEYRPEHHRYGTGARLAAVERHFTESSRIAFALLAGSREARYTAAFCAMLLTGGTGRPVPDERYAAQRQRLLRLGRAMRAPADGALPAWRDSVTVLRGDLEDDPETIIDTCLHLFCNRLGVTVPDEVHLRYLAACTAAELAGEE